MKLIRPMTVTSAMLTSSTVAETVSLYNAGTTYALGATVRQDAADGSWLYESLVAGESGNALTNTAKWLAKGATNRWKVFDGSVSSQTENADEIEYVIEATGRVDTIAILNVDASSVQVVAEDATDGEIYNETFSLVSPSGVSDIFAWLTEPIERLADIEISGLPTLYAGLTYTITINAPGATAKVGAIVLGLSKDIGGTQYGAQVEITDYSVKGTDDFGNITVIERAYAKRANFNVWVESGLVDQVQVLLARYRATPIVYSGSSAYGSTLIYGFFRDASVEIAGPNRSMLTIKIEGLT